MKLSTKMMMYHLAIMKIYGRNLLTPSSNNSKVFGTPQKKKQHLCAAFLEMP